MIRLMSVALKVQFSQIAAPYYVERGSGEVFFFFFNISDNHHGVPQMERISAGSSIIEAFYNQKYPDMKQTGGWKTCCGCSSSSTGNPAVQFFFKQKY